MLSQLYQDPLPAVIRDVHVFLSLCACADSSAAVQVARRYMYLQMECCGTSTALQKRVFVLSCSQNALYCLHCSLCCPISLDVLWRARYVTKTPAFSKSLELITETITGIAALGTIITNIFIRNSKPCNIFFRLLMTQVAVL